MTRPRGAPWDTPRVSPIACASFPLFPLAPPKQPQPLRLSAGGSNGAAPFPFWRQQPGGVVTEQQNECQVQQTSTGSVRLQVVVDEQADRQQAG